MGRPIDDAARRWTPLDGAGRLRNGAEHGREHAL